MAIQLEVGTAASPALQWTSATNTGIFLTGGNIAFSVGGTSRLTVNSSGQIGYADGTAAAPSFDFTNDTTTGFYRNASGTIGVSSSGTSKILLGTTSQTTPAITITQPIFPTTGEFRHIKMVGGQAFGGGYNILTNLTTTSTGATPFVIFTCPEQGGSFVMVSGTDSSGPGNVFLDILLAGRLLNPTVVASYSARGTPGARSYSLTGSSVQVSIAGATSYDVHAWQMSFPFGLG